MLSNCKYKYKFGYIKSTLYDMKCYFANLYRKYDHKKMKINAGNEVAKIIV